MFTSDAAGSPRTRVFGPDIRRAWLPGHRDGGPRPGPRRTCVRAQSRNPADGGSPPRLGGACSGPADGGSPRPPGCLLRPCARQPKPGRCGLPGGAGTAVQVVTSSRRSWTGIDSQAASGGQVTLERPPKPSARPPAPDARTSGGARYQLTRAMRNAVLHISPTASQPGLLPFWPAIKLRWPHRNGKLRRLGAWDQRPWTRLRSMANRGVERARSNVTICGQALLGWTMILGQ